MPHRANLHLVIALICSIGLHIALVAIPYLLPAFRSVPPSRLAANPAKRPPMLQKGITHAWLKPPPPKQQHTLPPQEIETTEPVITPATIEPRIYEAAQLTDAPEPIGEVQLPNVPAGLTSTGGVELILLIDPQGKVLDVTVGKSNMDPRALIPTLEAFRHTQFRPGTFNGNPVTSRIRIEVNLQQQ